MYTRKLRSPVIVIVLVMAFLAMSCNLGIDRSEPKNNPDPAATSTQPVEALPTNTLLPTKTLASTSAPTERPTLAPTTGRSIELPSGLILGDRDKTQAVMSTGMEFLRNKAKSKKETSGNGQTTVTHSIQVKSTDEALLWTTEWCAKDAETLAENIKSIQFDLSADGQPVDLDQAVSNTLARDNLQCQTYAIAVSQWPDTTTILESTTRITQTIHNGLYEYPAGVVYVDRYEVMKQPASNTKDNTVKGEGFSFQYPQDLATNVTVTHQEARTAGMRPFPAYSLHTFEGYPAPTDPVSGSPRLYVFSATEFIKVNQAIAKIKTIIQGLEAGKMPAEVAQSENGSRFGKPVIPFPQVVAGEQAYYLKFQKIDFQGGSGYAYLTQYQDTNNGNLSTPTYVFAGLGENDQLFIGVFPVVITGAPANAGIDDLLKPGAYTPNLDVLDELFSSIAVTK